MVPLRLSRSTDSQFYHVEDERGGSTACHHIALACFRHLLYGGTWARRTLCPDKPSHVPTVSLATGKYDLDTLPWSDSDESGGLCIFFHGMNASRKQWEAYIRQFPNSFPDMHFLAGSIYKAGNCSLEEAGNPFVEVVENYLQKFPKTHVVFIGTSNGARIASYIETKIQPELLKEHKLTVFSIAGVHGGTRLMDFAHKICWDKVLGHDPAIKKELSFHSQKSKDLIFSLQQMQKVWERQGTKVSHYFFATTEDEKVRPLSSSFPYLESTPLRNYQIIPAESHESIVDRVQKQIFNIIKSERG